jgi:chromosome partitioning protein
MAASIITFFAEKGGTGKTTLCFNLAGALASKGHKVLAVDCDKQGNLSKSFLDEERVLSLHPHNTVAAIWDATTVAMPDQLLHPSTVERISIIPANRSLKDYIMPNAQVRAQLQWKLAELIEDVAESFDFVLLDTSPDIDGLPAWSALLASHHVISPVEPANYSCQSFNGVGLQIQAAKGHNPKLSFLGFVFNRKDGRRKNHTAWIDAARQLMADKIFTTEFRSLDQIAKASEKRKPLAFLQEKAAAEAMKLVDDFAQEVLSRMKTAKADQSNESTRRSA